MAHQLIQKNVKRGLKVYDQKSIRHIDEKARKCTVTTQDNFTVDCRKIIFCTGFESLALLKEKIAELIYTYATVSEPHIELNERLNHVLIWDTNNPYLYMRTTDDGRFLVGGEDDVFSDSLMQQKTKEKKSKILIKKLQKTIPDIDFIEDISWGGVFGKIKDCLPYIGKSPEYSHCLFCLGFGGNGITFSMQGRTIIADILKSNKNELSYFYRFGR